jgi:hypothetical protein
LREAQPDLSLRSLGQRAGIPFQTVSTLLRAYQESPPALRGLFADGLAPGAVLELVPLFESAPQSQHQPLAKAMQGLTRRQAQGIRALVERGAAPHEAIQAALDMDARHRVAPIQPPEPPTQPGNGEASAEPRRPAAPLPSLTDERAIETLADYTGASKAKIKRLIEQARQAHVGGEVLTLACAYAGNRGDEGEAVQLAKLAFQDPDLYSLVRRFLSLKRRAKAEVKAQDDLRKARFIDKVIFGT